MIGHRHFLSAAAFLASAHHERRCFVRRHRAKTITSRAMGGMKRIIIIAGLTAAAFAGYAAYCPVRRPERH